MTSTTMGEKPKPWPVLETSRNRKLSRRAILAQPSLEETAARPVPAYVPGQLSLFIEPSDYAGSVGRVLEAMYGDFVTWRPDRGA